MTRHNILEAYLLRKQDDIPSSIIRLFSFFFFSFKVLYYFRNHFCFVFETPPQPPVLIDGSQFIVFSGLFHCRLISGTLYSSSLGVLQDPLGGSVSRHRSRDKDSFLVRTYKFLVFLPVTPILYLTAPSHQSALENLVKLLRPPFNLPKHLTSSSTLIPLGKFPKFFPIVDSI